MTATSTADTATPSPILTAFEASAYLRINDGSKDSLRRSRMTGELWGYPAPIFIQATRKTLYRKSDLDEFLAQLPRYTSHEQQA